MRVSGLLCLISLGVVSSNVYKIAFFVPSWIPSQLIWTVRVAEELAKAGHKITIIGIREAESTIKTPVIEEIEQWHVDAFVLNLTEFESRKSRLIYKEMSILDPDMREFFSMATGSLNKGCELVLQNKTFIDRLKAAKFDLAFNHMGQLCGVGLTRLANIPTWIWLSSGQLVDHMAEYIGVPSPPSYVPTLFSDSSDEMSFTERLKVLIGRVIIRLVVEKISMNPHTELFRKYVDPNFPDLIDLVQACPLVMVNSNEMYNFARPTLHKIIYIGGLGMTIKSAKPLTGDFKSIVDNAKQVAVMTFGSHANSSAMPEKWKNAFLDAFRKFPDVQFIVRYTTKDLDGKTPPNVHLKPWIPQTDLLLNRKTVLLITHGGYNSVQEAIAAGVPMVTIPLFGDQFGNARLVVKHGCASSIKKKDVSTETITKALQTVLSNPSYKKNAIRMRDMLLKKPSQPDRLLVEWTEFLAEFQQLPNLVPYGVNLNFIQYNCIDVIAFLATVAIVIIVITAKILKLIARLIIRKFIRKDAKKKSE
ncbi:unnamed protein product [Anisakis simplex]|uniref:UDP-glucuronosyltransferase n=1 Tax=Anisakis simplex TaxID=6269 RepID=A0A0M3K010_ANISI|nr:unnamed protein product [Anisakis simplex]